MKKTALIVIAALATPSLALAWSVSKEKDEGAEIYYWISCKNGDSKRCKKNKKNGKYYSAGSINMSYSSLGACAKDLCNE